MYVLLNTSESVLEYSATVDSSEEGSETRYEGKLQPQAVELLSPGIGNVAAGSITFEHDGLAGDLISIGLLQGESFLNPLPVLDPGAPQSTEYHSVRMPVRSRDSLGDPVAMQALVSAFNSSLQHEEASVVVFDQATGEQLTGYDGILEPGGVNTLDVAELLATEDIDVDADNVRVAVTHSGDPGSIVFSARSVGPDGQVIDVPLMGVRSAHHNGMYPLPGLEEDRVFTTLANLGGESASVVAQIDWEGGSYALPSITIEPGASHRIDIADLADNGPPDLLGRILDPEYEGAVLRWSSRAGSLSLIARTEAHTTGGGRFGFQGSGCCFEAPYGEILPPSPVFQVGDTSAFQASESRATCTGTMGPFLAENPSLHHESNFDWTAHVLSARSPGEGRFSFTAISYAIDATCSAHYAEYGGQGSGKAVPENTVEEDRSIGGRAKGFGFVGPDRVRVVASGYSTAGGGGTTPDPDSVDAVWIAQKDLASKFAVDDGSLLFDLPGASYRRLAVDPSQRTVWAVGKDGLASYAFDGTLNFLLTAMDTSNTALAVNPDDGTAWVGLNTSLSVYSAAGALQQSLTLASKAVDLAFDANLARMWAAGKLSVTAYDTSGTELLSLDVSTLGEIKSMTVSPVTGDVWVADKDELVRYDSAGGLLATLSIDKVANLEGDTLGGLWATTDDELYRFDAATGAILLQIGGLAGSGEIRALAVQADDNSVWLSLKKTLHRVSSAGQILQTLAVTKDVGEIAVYADAVGPELAFTAPAQGSFVATNIPTLGLSFSDHGIGVDTSTLAIQAGGNPLSVSCTFTVTTATCTPATALPEGLNNLTAVIADFEGNVSAQAAFSFTVDTIAPVITLDSPQDGDQVSTEEINFEGSLNEAGTLTLDGNPVTLGANNEFDHGPVTLSEGANVFQLLATDLAGNNSSETVTVTLVSGPFTFDPIGNQTADVGTTLTLGLTATDPGGDPVTFGTTTLPLPGDATLVYCPGSSRC